jgi:hypothetical protein
MTGAVAPAAAGHRRFVATGSLWVVLMMALVAIHSPGQMSVDSILGLYEGEVGQAVGWGPTFFAAFLKWLGGGVIGASLFVGLNVLLMYGALFSVLTGGFDARRVAQLPLWKYVPALVLCLNPILMFYAGILWKDVFLSTCAMVSVAGLLALERRISPERLWILAVLIFPLAAMPLIRQQGLLVAAPMWLALAWIVARYWRSTRGGRLFVFVLVLGVLAGANKSVELMSAATIAPLPNSPTSRGVVTVMAYDVIGTTAMSPTGEPARSHGADDATIAAMKGTYNPETIESSIHEPLIGAYFNRLGPDELATMWKAGVTQHTDAYLAHRWGALSALLGFGSMERCVAAYWGVSGPPEYLSRLNLADEMDPRDRLLGRNAIELRETFLLRNWPYVLLLAIVSIVLLRSGRREDTLSTFAAAIAAWLYFGSYIPTTIACDLRYLFPVVCLSTLLAVHLLSRPARPDQPSRQA